MKYTIAPEVFEVNPKLEFGVIVGIGLNNSESTPEDIALMRNEESYLRQTVDEGELRNLHNIREYRETMKSAGINPNKYQVSTEAMIKRVLKGNSLPSINSLVDLCNVISLKYKITMGGHDLADIHDDLSVCFSKGTERFLPFGSDEYESLQEGELIFTSGETVQTRKWLWRQSELGKMTLETKDVFFQLVGFEDGQGSNLKDALDFLEEKVLERFGGTCQRFVLDRDNPSFEFHR